MNPTPPHGKEARRLQAWRLTQQGWPQHQIAAAFGVSAGAVSQWLQRARKAGPEALRHRPPPGAPRRLSAVPLTRLPELWHRGPDADGCRGALWTRGRMAAVLQRAEGLACHPRQVGRLCQAIRWSPPKPTRRARQRDDVAMAPGREQTWPALNKGRRHCRQPSSA